MRMNKLLFRGLSGICALLFTVSLGATAAANDNEGFINAALNIETSSKSAGSGDYYYKTAYTEDGIPSDEGMAALLAAEDEFTQRELAESAVLLKNDGALPFTDDVKNVTLFGRASVDPLYRNAGGGPTVNADRTIDFKAALEGVGISINETLYTAYQNSSTKREINGSAEKRSIGEESISFYTSDIKASFKDYSDAAIVILSRGGGEGADLSLSDIDGVPALTLHQQEKDLLNMIRDSGLFDKVILIVNSGYAMELDWLDEYGVDACLWIGTPGMEGLAGVAELLVGNATPSGKLTDTYAASSLSSPVMMNFGSYKFAGSEDYKYVVEAEGIYEGYKYYETRYEDCVLDRYGASSTVGTYASTEGWNYAEEVTFPFGYGLSYTEFTETPASDQLDYDAATDTFSVAVEVTNTGSVQGKDVVELYIQAPYTDYCIEHGIEVSSILLVGFEKTGLLQPGESETVTISVPRYFLASYDDANGEAGEGGYVLQAGTYYFSVGSDAHDALNNVLCAKGATGLYNEAGEEVTGNSAMVFEYVVETDDTESFRYSIYEPDVEVSNQFTGDDSLDINYFYDEDVVTYLTRSDWENTYPVTVELTINDKLLDALDSYSYEKSSDALSVSDFTTGADNGITLADMAGADYDDERWDAFLDQMTVEELAVIVTDAGGTEAVASVAKPSAKHTDGPDGYGAKYKYGDKIPCTSYAGIAVLAASWDKALCEEFGNFFAEDFLYADAQMTWGPGANIHRSPYSGRNWEYFSECSMLTYILSSEVTNGIQEKGGIAAIKHLCANDQESGRQGIATFMTEQRLRQESLRGFEGALATGSGNGTMFSYNRLGCVADSISAPLANGILHGEWGFKGIIITDADGKENDYNPSVEGLMAGIDMHCNGTSRSSVISKAILSNDDGDLLQALRESNHRVYYTYANTNLVNGLSGEVEISSVTPWWKVCLYSLDSVLGALTLAATAVYVVSVITSGRKKEHE